MNLKERFQVLYPQIIYLSPLLSPELEGYLRNKNWLGTGEKLLLLEKPGEGNMNVVVRVSNQRAQFHIKTSPSAYAPPPGFNHSLARAFSGVEVLCRLIGATASFAEFTGEGFPYGRSCGQSTKMITSFFYAPLVYLYVCAFIWLVFWLQ
jgi:hypothetical protein